MKAKLVKILRVEDNPDDVALAQEVLKDAKMLTAMTVVEDGEEAMLFLRAEGEYSERELPDIILLDLNLPRKDGREVLEEIKGGFRSTQNTRGRADHLGCPGRY